MRNLYIAVGIVGIALGSIGILMLVAPSVPPTEPAKFRWSRQFPNVPDSYDPAKDGPVWLGPYRFDVPLALGGGPAGMVFQMLVIKNEVQFYSGGAVPEDGWLTYNVIEYLQENVRQTEERTLTILPKTSPWLISWIPPSLLQIEVPYILNHQGKALGFECTVPMNVFRKAYPTRDLGALTAVFPGPRCRAWLALRQGVSLLFEFPTSRINEAELPVLKAIEMIHQAIKEK